MKIENLPSNAILRGDEYYYEIDPKLNHITSRNEKCVIYEGRRYVIGLVDQQNDYSEKRSDIREKSLKIYKEISILGSLSVFCYFSSILHSSLCSKTEYTFSGCALSSALTIVSSIIIAIRTIRFVPLLGPE